MKLCVILYHYSSPPLPPCKDSGYLSNKNDVYCSAGNMRMNTCANVANKNLETIS